MNNRFLMNNAKRDEGLFVVIALIFPLLFTLSWGGVLNAYVIETAEKNWRS